MMNNSSLIRSNLLEAQNVLNDFISDEKNIMCISDAVDLITSALRKEGKIISCGNGGSMCDAMHFAEEMTGRFRDDRKPFAAIAISDPSHISCVANDYGYEYIFSRFLEATGKKGDVLLAISTSGNSKNILEALASAKKMGIKIIGLTGRDGGKMASLCDIEIRAAYSPYADRTQEIHIKIIHSLIHCIEEGMR